ncbi:uncharacterized protein LOC126743258 [Anthonomus grandis grandis]|uniref:uncharacterized protein LOC126743258 n=1 Tax=Anthonomus grandis grandis TaxID=2921223 RepID=UPI0021652E29|nr:uncharacterized protein LOC126743258 [Anthonomus grandis grandis]
MRSFIVLSALIALATAQPAEKQKRGLLELEHAPALVHAAPLYDKSYATPIIHGGPVVTKVFEAPPVPLVRSYGAPIITGPLITKGIGPHIIGAKPILHAPIIKAAAPIYAAHAPIISYAPKIAPIALGHHLW